MPKKKQQEKKLSSFYWRFLQPSHAIIGFLESAVTFPGSTWSGKHPAPDGPLPVSAQKLPRVGNTASNRAGRHRHGGSQKDLRFFVAHAPREIPVRRADAFHR